MLARDLIPKQKRSNKLSSKDTLCARRPFGKGPSLSFTATYYVRELEYVHSRRVKKCLFAMAKM